MPKFRVGSLVAVVAACALGVFAAPASALQWNVTQLSEESSTLFGASCPTPSFCVVVGSNGTVASSSDPTGGTSAWQVSHFIGLEEVHESGSGDLYSGAQVRGVSCPSPQFCVAMSRQGYVYASTNPTGGGLAFKTVALQPPKKPRVHVNGVSCPSPSLCVGVASAGKIVTSTDPSSGTATWSVTQLGQPLELTGVSCPSEGFCAAVSKEGGIVTSTNPAGGAATWSAPATGFGELLGVSCPSPTLCVTGNSADIYVSTNAAAPSSWKPTPDVTPLPIMAFSCPTNAACAAVNNNADVITSTNPTGGTGAWSFTNAIPIPPNGMFGISCPSTSFCAAAGAHGQVITSTSPFGGSEPANLKAGGHHRRRTVKITRHPRHLVKIRGRRARVRFRFRAIGPGRGFLCKLDRRKYSRCRSPKRYRVGRGRHAFRVKAFDPGGIAQVPAVFRFWVVRRR